MLIFSLTKIFFNHNLGNIRRFRRVCEHIQSQVCSRRPPPSPRATRKFTTELSESSSCGSDTSERLSPYPGTRQVITEHCNKEVQWRYIMSCYH